VAELADGATSVIVDEALSDRVRAGPRSASVGTPRNTRAVRVDAAAAAAERGAAAAWSLEGVAGRGGVRITGSGTRADLRVTYTVLSISRADKTPKPPAAYHGRIANGDAQVASPQDPPSDCASRDAAHRHLRR
jgi:hypothetical protein